MACAVAEAIRNADTASDLQRGDIVADVFEGRVRREVRSRATREDEDLV